MAHSLQRGQALLIVILIMIISLTVGLAIVSRSITNLRVSTEEENSQRALSAAEAGIEILQKNLATRIPITISGVPLNTNSELSQIESAELKNITGNEIALNNGAVVEKNDGVDFWLSDYPGYGNQWPSSPTGQFDVYWGSSTDPCTDAAIEIILIKRAPAPATPTTERYAYDPCGARSVNGFTNAPSAGGAPGSFASTYKYKTNPISLSSAEGIVARIIPLYAKTPIGVKNFNGLPDNFNTQGSIITSVGVSGGSTSSGGTSGVTKRKVVFYKGFPQLPSELFNGLFCTPGC